ncbi:MAG: M28 family peptidase, partial [Cyanobacteriota bacterium]
EGGGFKPNKHLQESADKMADKLGINYEHLPRNDRTDAHAFEKAGYPAITFLWAWKNDMSNRPHYHDVTDRPEIANYDNLNDSTKLALATVWDLSNKKV